MADTYHWFMITQGKGVSQKWVIIGLREDQNKTEGKWYSDESDVSDVGKKAGYFQIGPGTHRSHLFWRWNSSTLQLNLGSGPWKNEALPDREDIYLTLMGVHRNTSTKQFTRSGRGLLLAPGNHLRAGEVEWAIAAPRLYTVGVKGSENA